MHGSPLITAALTVAVLALGTGTYASADNTRPTRFDPYKSFKFRLVDGAGETFAGFDVASYRQGGDASTTRKGPGRDKYEVITLQRGVTQDSAFGSWANAIGSTPGPTRTLELQTLDASGVVTKRLTLTNCSPVAPATNAKTENASTLQQLVLQCESVTSH